MPLIARCWKMKTATVLAVAGLGASLVTPLAVAQAAAPSAAGGPQALRIAVLDTEKILLNSQAGKKALAELKKAQEQKENEIKARQKEISDLQDKLSNGKLALAADKIAEIDKQLEDKSIALRRLQDDATRDLNKMKDELLGGIDTKVMPVINQIGKELGYTLIFRKFESGLIYADEAVDITNTIIQRLDAQSAK